MLDKNEIRKLFDLGRNKEVTHMIVFYDCHNCKYFTRYVGKGRTVDEIIRNELQYSNNYNIEAIYNYDLDLESQLNEEMSYHNEPSKKYKTNYELALEYAKEKHKGQIRKGYNHKPYITHPIEVSKLVEKYMKDDPEMEKYKVAALLHDTLEDADATYEELENFFGKDIADIVQEVTNNDDEKERLGKDVYLALKLSGMKQKTLTLKLCDRLHNVTELIYDSEEFNEKYVRETVYVINYNLLNRDFSSTNLELISDIMKTIRSVSVISPMLIKPKKRKLKNNNVA